MYVYMYYVIGITATDQSDLLKPLFNRIWFNDWLYEIVWPWKKMWINCGKIYGAMEKFSAILHFQVFFILQINKVMANWAH